MPKARLVTSFCFAAWVVGTQVWYYQQFAGVVRGLLNSLQHAR